MPHLGEDVGAVAVVTVRLAVVGGEARASQDGARAGTVVLCALPLAVAARAVCVDRRHTELHRGSKTALN